MRRAIGRAALLVPLFLALAATAAAQSGPLRIEPFTLRSYDGRERPAERLRLTGELMDVTTPLAAADVLAVPSRNEGMGRVIVEGMAIGIPVVATAVGGIPDVVTDGECGRLVEPDDVDALAAALIELGRDDALRRKLGEAGERRAEAFSAPVASAKLLAVYRALARAKGLE